jgi:hypothetical protein
MLKLRCNKHRSYLERPTPPAEENVVEIHYQAMANEGIEDLASTVVRIRVHELV